MKNTQEFIRLTGSKTIHRTNCSYVSKAAGQRVSLVRPTLEHGEHFCRRCCRDLQRKACYMVLDLEMCRVSPKLALGISHEIIQIGAVMLSESYEVVSEFSTYVHPQYGQIDPYIRKLTGIDQAQTEYAPQLPEALDLFMNWMQHFRVERIYAWSETDYMQLDTELSYKELRSGRFSGLLEGYIWEDYQKTFDVRYGYGRRISLEDALLYCSVEPEGRAHNGLDDALNTGRLIAKLTMHPDYKPYVTGTKREQLTFSLGDLLKINCRAAIG